MKIGDVAFRTGRSKQTLIDCARHYGIELIDDGNYDYEVDNKDLAKLAELYDGFAKEQAERRQEEHVRKQDHLASMLITSGFNFDGYTITKYSGYISGDDAIEVSRDLTVLGFSVTGSVRDRLMSALTVIRRNALIELKEAAYDLGCNAVIGVDFDYLTLEPTSANLLADAATLMPYIIGVTANGNAVVIEKNE